MIKKNSAEEYQNLLKKFPKTRPTLSQKYKDIYNQHYISNREGSGFANLLSQKMEAWMHKKTSSINGKNIGTDKNSIKGTAVKITTPLIVNSFFEKKATTTKTPKLPINNPVLPVKNVAI